MMKLYTYYRSSAAYRVRIALNLKGLDYDSIPVHLVRNNGEQRAPEYLAMNPQGLLPLLELDGDSNESQAHISQSLAILEYLEERFPEKPLLPQQIEARAHVRALCLAIACEIHPLNNLRVLQYLSNKLEISNDQKSSWYKHWVSVGFSAIESSLKNNQMNGDYCFGDTPSMADCCLIPQVYNAQRFNCDLNDFPRINRINKNCLALKAFQDALPENQADADL